MIKMINDISAIENLELKKRAVELTQTLIRFPSITPDDAGSFDFLQQRLTSLGFTCEEVTREGVRNLIAEQTFGEGETLAFAGHLDVVPAGPENLWRSPPFAADIIGGRLYGRGVADMKGGIACFVAAVESLIEHCCRGKLMFLITCDEEGDADHGTLAIMEHLNATSPERLPEYCLVGEPSSKQQLGDAIKIGRRGAISAQIKVFGRQGHVGYPADCENSAHYAVELSKKLLELQWDPGSEQMPGTSLQITQLNTGKFVDNVVPGVTLLCFNIRYSSQYDEQELKRIVNQVLDSFDFKTQASWEKSCIPYFNAAGEFVDVVNKAIFGVMGRQPILTTDGGTSDGRFIASNQTQVIEFGLKNDTIHQINESAAVADLEHLAHIYQSVISRFCLQSSVPDVIVTKEVCALEI